MDRYGQKRSAEEGRELYVPRLPAASASSALCAVAALERWLEVVGAAGLLFRTFDLRGRLTATRRGFITNAAKKKIPIESIKRVTGQRSNAIVLDYVEAATLDDDPPLLGIVAS